MKKKFPLILLIALIILLVTAIIVLVKIRLENIVTIDYQKYEYPETNAHLDNPGRGFYQIFGYVLKDDGVYASLDDVPNLPPKEAPEDPAERESWNKHKNDRLIQIQINLRNYADAPLSESALKQLDMILQAWSRTDRAIILRFLYDWDAQALEHEPKQIAQIQEHMKQTAEIYNRYADSIFLIQGLSTGNTGEMNNTNYGSKEDLALLGKTLAQASEPSIYLSVRTPNQWRDITSADSYEKLQTLSDSPFLGRLGLFNDGMLGNDSDTGTYTDRSREEELAFQDRLCQTVPNGGEVIVDNPYNDLDRAIKDLRVMHVSYLNSDHDLNVINRWSACTYHGSDAFDGVSGLEYIREHLGYRYVLRDSSVSARTAGKSKEPALFLTIENAGFSVNYRKTDFVLTLVDTETKESYTIRPEYDEKNLPGSKTSVWEIPIDPRLYPPANYQLYWQTTDRQSGDVIRYGNENPLTEYGCLLGSLTIDTPYKRSD